MNAKINVFIFFLTINLFSACTINVNQPNSNEASIGNSKQTANVNSESAAKSHWSVAVCSSRAKTVTFSAGTDENSGEVFATWREGEGRKVFDFPDRLQNLSRIYFKASASDKNQVELCVLFDGVPKKRVEFDDDEDVIVSSTDTDELDKCRCSE